MIRLLIKNWWLLFLRGVLAIAFAIFIYAFLPFLPVPFLRQFAFAGLAAYLPCSLASLALSPWQPRCAERVRATLHGLMLADGIGVTIGGLVILLFPGLTLIHVIQFIAVTALVVGILEVVAGVHLRRHVTDEWLLIGGGIISIRLRRSLAPDACRDMQAALTWISLYALANGLAMIGLSLRLRSLRNSIHKLAELKPEAQAASQSKLV